MSSAGLPRVLVTERAEMETAALRLLEGRARVVLRDLSRAELLRAAADAEVLWIRLRHRIDAEVLEAAPALRCIVSPTTGLNHIDLRAAESRGVSVLSLRGEADFLREVRATAEHTLALALALLRGLPQAVEHTRSGGWDRDRFVGREIHGKTAGVVGYGRLGRLVAGYLQAFGARVLAADPCVAPGDCAPGVALVGLDELLAASDLVTLHVDLREETRGFFGAEQFARMRPGAWFVNTARGELVDEAALLEALRSGRLAGAALDVLADERAAGMAGHPLVEWAAGHANLLLTPHIGGRTAESAAKTEAFMAERLLAFLEGAGTPVAGGACR